MIKCPNDEEWEDIMTEDSYNCQSPNVSNYEEISHSSDPGLYQDADYLTTAQAYTDENPME